MTLTCPHCTKKLKLNQKIISSVSNLPVGESLRLKCPQCENTIFVDKNTLQGVAESNTPDQTEQKTGTKHKASIQPPSPPDITWLKEGIFTEEEAVEDIPQALILIRPGKERDQVAEAIESIGYQPTFAESAEDAMERMQFVNYASVIHHSQFEDKGLDQSSFHQFMCSMNMLKRRFIFYILLGPEFFTLYDLEALAHSANLVVNTKEIPQLLTILRKSIPQYEELFGTLMAEINAYSGG